MANMFEIATKTKMRFPFKGQITVEDLWDLSVQSLDSIYKNLNAELKQTQEDSLLDTKTEHDKELETKIEIIKYVVQVKQAEKDAAAHAKEVKQNNQKILEVIAKKQDEALNGKSIDELKSMLQ
jgi:hypothetical protein